MSDPTSANLPPADSSSTPVPAESAPDFASDFAAHPASLDHVLALRQQAGLLRSRRVVDAIDATHVRVDGRALVQFCSNDYLGLAHTPHGPRVNAAAGAAAAPLIAGHSRFHAQAERAIADLKNAESAVLLPSGYQANLAAVQACAGIAEAMGRSPRFLLDKLSHASLIDAVRSTGGELRVFPHNHLGKLERLLVGREPRAMDFVVTESIFSMDGDAADLRSIAALRQRCGFTLVLDEAHATGIRGPGGSGLAAELGLGGSVDLGIATLSKAVGRVGGAVYGSAAMMQAVVNFGRAYIYSTAVPPATAALIHSAIDVVRGADDRRERLKVNIRLMRDGLQSIGVKLHEFASPIIPIHIGTERDALAAARRLLDAGLLVVAVRPPTVPPGTSRLRVTVSSQHTAAQIRLLIDRLRECLNVRA